VRLIRYRGKIDGKGANLMNQNAAALTEKIRLLSPEQAAEVEDFVEFLRFRGQERGLTRAAAAASEPAFEAVWSSSEDDAYDAL
jgi:hypothetical protein